MRGEWGSERGEEGGKAEGVLERAEDWGAEEGAWERGSEGAGAVLGCLGGSQDFGEADTRFGAVRFLGEVPRFPGRGMKGNSGWSKAVRSRVPSPESREGIGISGAEISREARVRGGRADAGPAHL